MREETYCSKGRNGWYISNVSKDYEGVFEIPLGVEIICENAFRDCKNITEIVLPNSIKVISGCAFYVCTGLKSIVIPDSVKRIKSGAFGRCDNLTSIHLKYENFDMLNIDMDAFRKTDLKNIILYVPIGTGYAYRHHPLFSQFKEVIIER